MIIFINNIQFLFLYFLNNRDLLFCKALDSFVGKKQLYHISLIEFFCTFAFFTIERNVFLTHHLVKEALRCKIHVFCQEFVQTLSGFVGSDFDFLHEYRFLSYMERPSNTFLTYSALPSSSSSVTGFKDARRFR